jgi:hypothetical protein
MYGINAISRLSRKACARGQSLAPVALKGKGEIDVPWCGGWNDEVPELEANRSSRRDAGRHLTGSGRSS